MKERLSAFFAITEMLHGDVRANSELIDALKRFVANGEITPEEGLRLYEEIAGEGD